jgi:hypothetical protein
MVGDVFLLFRAGIFNRPIAASTEIAVPNG